MLIFSKKSIKFQPNFAIKIEFRPVRRNVDLVDLEKCCKMIPWSQKSASIQRRTSPPKFLENRGSRMGVPGVMIRASASRIRRDRVLSRLSLLRRFLHPDPLPPCSTGGFQSRFFARFLKKLQIQTAKTLRNSIRPYKIGPFKVFERPWVSA